MTCPLPLNGVVRIMATLMFPGLLVLGTIIAPEMRLPWVTTGADNRLLS